MKHIVFYDAQCPFCYHVKLVLKKLDWFGKIEWKAVQEAEQEVAYYDYLEGRNVYDEIHMLSSDNVLYSGFYTVRKLMSMLPLTAPFAMLLYIPLIDKIGVPLYNWFSQHRYQWFGRYETPQW
ncbi:thiol-disulfide oxidoreductase DCC family protein [Pontibacillus salicampi]|uniref:Thiol-disulfide oxidoreductase DCC family protein n=1 Tax=Pontibacillus salicampi TaxID=1449801 RepID=A0ABV6LQC8_9BACI